MQKGWARLSEPLPLYQDPPIWLVLQPKTVSFSGMTSANNIARASISASVEARAIIGERPASLPASDIPPLTTLPPNAALAFKLGIPLLATYPELAAQLHQLANAGKPIPFETSQGAGSVVVKDVSAYPSGKKIVVATTISADLPGRWLDVTGTFYVSCVPAVDIEKRTLRLKDVTLTRTTDSLLVDAATAVLAIRPVMSVLEEHAQFPLGKMYDEALARTQAALNAKISDDVQLKGSLNQFEIADIVVTGSGVVPLVSADGQLEVLVGI